MFCFQYKSVNLFVLFQYLLQDKEFGYKQLMETSECGEKLFPSTSHEGREIIRQQLRSFRQEWDSLFDEILATQRQVEAQLFHWTSFSESTSQLDHWLSSMESLQSRQIPLANTLEEKKTQLQSFKVKIVTFISYHVCRVLRKRLLYLSHHRVCRVLSKRLLYLSHHHVC